MAQSAAERGRVRVLNRNEMIAPSTDIFSVFSIHRTTSYAMGPGEPDFILPQNIPQEESGFMSAGRVDLIPLRCHWPRFMQWFEANPAGGVR